MCNALASIAPLQAHLTATVQHTLMARGDDIRRVRVADFFGATAPTSPLGAITLTINLFRSKTNTKGGREELLMYRHKDALRCPVGAIYLWLHWCFDVTDEGAYDPDLHDPRVHDMHIVSSSCECLSCLFLASQVANSL